jgi:hypothetical protein
MGKRKQEDKEIITPEELALKRTRNSAFPQYDHSVPQVEDQREDDSIMQIDDHSAPQYDHSVPLEEHLEALSEQLVDHSAPLDEHSMQMEDSVQPDDYSAPQDDDHHFSPPPTGPPCSSRQAIQRWRMEEDSLFQQNSGRVAISQTSQIVPLDSSQYSQVTASSQAPSSQMSITSNRRLKTIKSVPASQKKCFHCGSVGGRSRIPKAALKQVWEKKNILLPQNNRTCSDHLLDGLFRENVLEEIEGNKMGVIMSDTEIANWILELSTRPAQKYKRKVRFDFAALDDIPPEDYVTLTGYDKDVFDRLFDVIKHKLKDSPNRHPKNALAMLMCLFRLNVSQPVLATMFGINNPQTVSDTIKSVTSALTSEFVPHHFGFGHIGRQEAIEHHGRKMFRRVTRSQVRVDPNQDEELFDV